MPRTPENKVIPNVSPLRPSAPAPLRSARRKRFLLLSTIAARGGDGLWGADRGRAAGRGTRTGSGARTAAGSGRAAGRGTRTAAGSGRAVGRGTRTAAGSGRAVGRGTRTVTGAYSSSSGFSG